MSKKTMATGVCVLMAMVMLACGAAPEPADLVITGGRIVTLDPERPEVEAMAARGQKIIATGSAAEMAKLIGGTTEVIDLDGATPSQSLSCGVPEMEGPNTTHFSILDRDGNRVAATLSINLLFGSGFVPPEELSPVPFNPFRFLSGSLRKVLSRLHA